MNNDLFLFGKHASNPFKQVKTGPEDKPYEGRTCPTFFKFKGKDPGAEIAREAHINMRCRIAFETDAVNDYLSRSIDPGTFELFLLEGAERRPAKDIGFASNVNLQNGIASRCRRPSWPYDTSCHSRMRSHACLKQSPSGSSQMIRRSRLNQVSCSLANCRMAMPR